jgi:GT2 family glycosyltransferase
MFSLITVSIVLYNSNVFEIEKILAKLSFCNVFLIDNSPSDDLRILANNTSVLYIHNPSNPGFGAAHNIALKKAIKMGSKYHFIINPDVFFESNVINIMVDVMKNDSIIGMIMPQILNLDGTIQYLPKLLPSPLSIFLRKIKHPIKLYTKFISKYELRFVPNDLSYNAPILSGCFTLLNLNIIQEVGMYDDKFFMYFEDWDLSRRIHKKYKTIYFPQVSVYHGYESGANKSGKLFKIFIKSAIIYFNKWGWFFDSERHIINKTTLEQFNQCNKLQ